MKKEDLDKNICDLKHNLNLVKAGTFLGLAFTSWISIFSVSRMFFDSRTLPLALSTLVAIIFLVMAIIMFERCKTIYAKLEKMKES